MKSQHECIVVGGGLAGSCVAWHLARSGYRVAVLEKSTGPHHKVCGEFLSFEALAYLDEMGVSLREDTPVIKEFRLFAPHLQAAFTFPAPGRGVSRYELDEDLLSNAARNGADVYRGVCVVDYQWEMDGSFRIKTNGDDFYAAHVFMATGKHDWSNKHRRLGKDNAYIGLKAHVRVTQPHAGNEDILSFYTFPGGYGGLCPVGKDVLNFSFIIKRNIYKSLGGDFNKVIAYVRRANPGLDAFLQRVEFTGPRCAVGHIPYGFLGDLKNEDDVYMVGDQRMVIPSFTGDGMAIALSTARDCAQAFDAAQRHRTIDVLPMQRLLRKQMRWALLGHGILKCHWLLRMCAVFPAFRKALIETIFKKTRIPLVKGKHGPHAAPFKDSYSGR